MSSFVFSVISPLEQSWLNGSKYISLRGSRVGGGGGGGRGPDPHMKNHRNKGLLCNTCLDPLNITKLPSQYSMFGHYSQAGILPFKWRFACGPMMARLKWYLELNKNNVNMLSKLDPSNKTF